MVKNNKTTKKCPHCKEEVLIDARKCKHCGEWLETKETKKGAEDVVLRQPNEEAKKTSNSGFIGLIIILVIVFLFMSWSTRFMIFAFLSFVALLIGLTEPDRFKKLIKKPTRKNIGLVFGCAVLAFLILFGITTPKNPTIAFNDLNDSSKEVTVGNFDIKGKVSPADSAIKIKKDNKTYITTSKPDKNGNFTYNVDLNEGDNNFSFTADNHGKTFSISKKLVRKLSQEETTKKDAEAKAKAEEEAKAKADADAKKSRYEAGSVNKLKNIQPIFLGTSKDNWTKLSKYILAGDDTGVKNMIYSGEALIADGGSQIKTIEWNWGIFHVRILEGTSKDSEAWVSDTFVE
ncbi:MAG: hypothetical protein NTZ65_02225 [Candidatus Berkelbacteria bacterium]|nr:hypothetical protein [Candidatus Berkelbacteria bacterium]